MQKMGWKSREERKMVCLVWENIEARYVALGGVRGKAIYLLPKSDVLPKGFLVSWVIT
jgi:hypothetical protein